VPVLAVRRPVRGPYRHPTLALDTAGAPADVMTMLLRLMPPPRPMFTVVHAYEIPLRGRLYPSLSEDETDAVRDQFRDEALAELDRQLVRLQADAAGRMSDIPGWRIQARTGSARAVIMRAVKQEHTDVLALATHGYRGLAHAFLGTVAGDVLRHVHCDVLVVPPREGP
jgi:nucleotide-binding universal stress UspA family protein